MTCVSPTGDTLTGNAYRNEVNETTLLRVALKYGFTQNIRVSITDQYGSKEKFVIDIINGSVSVKAGTTMCMDPKCLAQITILSNFYRLNKKAVRDNNLEHKIIKTLYKDRMDNEWKDMPKTKIARKAMWEATLVLGYISKGNRIF